MATYVMDTGQEMKLDWTAKGVQRILQNVRNLISTWKYEVAYSRIKGIDPSIIDRPADVAAALYVAEVYQVVGDYEPRAALQDVQFTGVDEEGNMQFRVVIEI